MLKWWQLYSSTIVINRHRLELHRFAMVCKISQVVCFSLQKTGCWSRFWPAENPARSRQVSITPTRPISAGSSIDRPWDFAEKTPASRSILQCILLQWALPSLMLWERNDAAVDNMEILGVFSNWDIYMYIYNIYIYYIIIYIYICFEKIIVSYDSSHPKMVPTG